MTDLYQTSHVALALKKGPQAVFKGKVSGPRGGRLSLRYTFSKEEEAQDWRPLTPESSVTVRRGRGLEVAGRLQPDLAVR